MNRGMNLGVNIDDDNENVTIDVDVNELSSDEMVKLFGVLMGYFLRDLSDYIDSSEIEESFQIMLMKAVETFFKLSIDGMIDEMRNSSNTDESDNEQGDIEINFDMNQIDNALNKMLEDFENGR